MWGDVKGEGIIGNTGSIFTVMAGGLRKVDLKACPFASEERQQRSSQRGKPLE